MKTWAISVGAVLLATACWAGPKAPPEVPDPRLTPGDCRTDITLEELCKTKWGKDARKVTAAMKLQVFHSYGYTGNADRSCKGKRHWEIDHSCSRELGGKDTVENLWPQCYAGTWNAVMKDRLENRLHKEVCAGTLTLIEAQDGIKSDWRIMYRRYFGEP